MSVDGREPWRAYKNRHHPSLLILVGERCNYHLSGYADVAQGVDPTHWQAISLLEFISKAVAYWSRWTVCRQLIWWVWGSPAKVAQRHLFEQIEKNRPQPAYYQSGRDKR